MVEVLIVLLLMHVAIALHELGHYVVYRKYRVPVLGVYLGGPPWVLQWKRKGTEYRLGLIPLFGAVLVREDDAKHLTPPDWVRVYLAGPLASLLAALAGFVLWGVLKGSLVYTLKAFAAILIFLRVLLHSSTPAILSKTLLRMRLWTSRMRFTRATRPQ
jgi:membrane-associated protease RseP (regulator of RpoE activity)